MSFSSFNCVYLYFSWFGRQTVGFSLFSALLCYMGLYYTLFPYRGDTGVMNYEAKIGAFWGN